MRTIAVLVSVAVSMTSACAATPTVRHVDLEAWKGAPLIDLETHSMFSTAMMNRSVQPLSDGGELWTYSACERWVEDTRCVAVGGQAWAAVNCKGGRTGQRCCHNRFYVRDKAVAWYRTAGACFTDCDTRPASRPCSAEERQ